MKSIKNKGVVILILTLIFSLSFYFVAQGGGTKEEAVSKEVKYIKIGYTAPFTGAAAEFGVNGWRGVQLALEDINKNGIIINGDTYKIKIIRYDSICTPTEAVANVRKLILEDKVVAILGDHCSSCCLGIAPLCDKYKIPGITIECMSDDITSPGHPFYFRMYIPSGLVAIWASPVIKEALNPKTVAFIAINDDYGRTATEGFSKELSKLGVKTLTKEFYERGTTDYTAYLNKIKALSPDLLMFTGVTPECAMLLKQIREIGLLKHTKFVGSVEESEQEIVKLAGPDLVEGIYAWAVWGEVPEDLSKRVKEKYNAPMHYGITYGYDALMVVARAIEKAQSLDPVKIRDAIASSDFEGYSGHIKFESFDAPNGRHYSNQCRIRPYLIKWENGKRILVK